MKSESSISIGTAPWKTEEIVASIDEFLGVYEKRPLKANAGGMGIPHLFATWYLVRHLKPRVIVESGVWKGLGTWILEQAAPEAQVISIDPFLDKREYISPNVTYHSIDFTEIDWSEIDTSTALVFFDDHQSAYNRLIHCHWFGFRHVIFEDNYLPGCGDFYTLRHAFGHSGFGVPQAAEKKAQSYSGLKMRLWRFLSGKFHGKLHQGAVIPQYCRDNVVPNAFDEIFLRRNLEVYAEFPPVYSPTPGAASVFGEEERGRYPLFYDGRGSYNQICYVRLKGPRA